jgi:hypothetical protein
MMTSMLIELPVEQMRALRGRHHITCGGRPLERAWALLAAITAIAFTLAIAVCA